MTFNLTNISNLKIKVKVKDNEIMFPICKMDFEKEEITWNTDATYVIFPFDLVEYITVEGDDA